MVANETLAVPFMDLKAQYHSLKDELDNAVLAVLGRGDFILGRDVGLLEEEFAKFCGTKHAIGVDTGLSAIELVLRALNIGAGDEVITVANTFIATVLGASASGAIPVLVDCDPDTYNIDPGKIEAAITEKTKAIIPVHLYGQPADMDPILEIAKKHNLYVLEDAAQAHGAYYKGQRAGSIGDAGTFSFYPAKNLGAYGDGGMIVTNNDDVAQTVRMYRNYGQSKKYHHDVKGTNCRLDTVQAAVLRVKLNHIDDWNGLRNQHAAYYTEQLSDTGFGLPVVAADTESVWHLYVIRTTQREALMEFMAERNISTGIHYPVPVHMHPAYSELNHLQGQFPNTEQYASEIVSLPMYPELTPELLDHVVKGLKDFEALHGA